MKKIALILLLFGVWHERATLRDALLPASPAATAAASEEQIVLLATQWCGYCAKTRRFFADNEVPYTEYDVEESAAGQARYRAVGANGVPVILVGERVIHGYDLRALRELVP